MSSQATLTNMRAPKTCPSSPAIRTPAGAFLLLLSLSVHAPAQSPTPDSLNPGASFQAHNNAAYVDSVVVQADGKILVGGIFDTLGGQSRTNIGRLNRDGSLDLDFNPAAAAYYTSPEVFCMAVQPDGKILVGGAFTTLSGQSRTNIGRLNADGSPDVSFQPAAATDEEVKCIALQPDGKIIVGGFFYFLNGEVHPCIGRLNTDGTVDESFQATAGVFFGAPYVSSLALQSDGKILVAGYFTSLDDRVATSVGRLNSDGTLDPNFNPLPVGGGPVSVALQSDGKILLGPWGGAITRLNASGGFDTSFDTPGDATIVSTIAVQADEKILAGGVFTTLSGESHTNLARLNSDGTLDAEFNVGTDSDSSWVLSLGMQSDGKTLVGGGFAMLAGQSRTNIGRLNATDPATQSLSFDGSTVTWMRGGTSPEVWRTTFDFLNGVAWAPLGEGVRVPGGWELGGLSSLPTNATVRARGFVSTGGIGDSFVETVLNPSLAIADARLSGGRLVFNLLGPAGQEVTIETSPDLSTWAPLQAVKLGIGPFPFTDPQTGTLPNRFYRLRAGL
jgi:uncharacterized delta-60 repeat protein